MQAALVLWQKHMRKFWRSRIELVATLAFPLLLMAMFGAAMRRLLTEAVAGLDYLSYISPAILALTALTASVLGGSTLLNERMRGVMREYLAAPIPRSAILVATLASAMTKALVQSGLVLLVGLALGIRPDWTAGGLALALLAFTAYAAAFVALSAAAAATSPSVEAYHSLIMLFNVPLLFTSNAFYPLDAMPGWLRAIALVNPTTYLMDAVRTGLFGAPADLGIILDLAVLAGVAVLSGVWAVRSFGRVTA